MGRIGGVCFPALFDDGWWRKLRTRVRGPKRCRRENILCRTLEEAQAGGLLSEAVERAGLGMLNEGQQVEFEIVSNRGKSAAENLKVK